MFGLFSDYKTTEEIDLLFAAKRLKAHYTLYTSLISSWEERILESIGSLGQDDHQVGDWIKDWQGDSWDTKHFQAEIAGVEEMGLDERIAELEEKLKEVEVGLGNRMIKKQYAEKEMTICAKAAEIVKQSEQNVKTLRRKLRKYPKRQALLNQKVGVKLLRRRRMYDVLDILELVLPTALLGASTKKQMVRLIKEQDWNSLEPTKFLNLVAVRQGIGSLKSKVAHFEKEIKDEFCQLLQRPSLEGFKTLLDFLHGMPACKARWDICNRKFSRHFKDELDSLFQLLSSPMHFFEQSLTRLVSLWFSSLNFFDHDRAATDQSPRSSTLRPRRSIVIEPSIIIGCLISISENVRTCMANWDRVAKYTFIHENTLKHKVTDESEALAFNQQVREALFVSKALFLKLIIREFENQIVKLKEEQLSRLALKHMLQLRIRLATFYHDAQAFSISVPENKLEKEIENLVDVFLDQNFSSQFDMLIAMIRTSDVDLITIDFPSLSRQISEVILHLQEVSPLQTFKFASQTRFGDSLSKKLNDLLQGTTDPTELKERIDRLRSLYDEEKGFPLSSSLDEAKTNLESLLSKQEELAHLKLDYTSSALSSVIITQYKHWVYFPEYPEKIKGRLESLHQLNYLFNLLKLVSPVTVQFLLSGGFSLKDVRSEDQFNQLENFHDIVLFQKRFKRIRRSMKELDEFLEGSSLTNFKEKLSSSIAEILSLAIIKPETKDKLALSFERAVKTLLAFESVDKLGLSSSHAEEINEIEDLVFYHILLNQTKDQQVFTKISKYKWEEVRDSTLVSDYATEIVNSIKSVCGLISKIGKNS